MKRTIAITMGDPEGIGPEIIQKTLSRYHSRNTIVILGNFNLYPDKKIPRIFNVDKEKDGGVFFYHMDAPKNRSDASFEYVRKAADFILKKKMDALVTAPISKKKWKEQGICFNGHTDFLAHHAGVKQYCMFFWSENARVALFTAHVPLKKIFPSIQTKKIIAFMRFLDAELTRLFSLKFNFIFSGLNPHAGEDGHMGLEERDKIKPALDVLSAEMNIRGIYSPDSVFLKSGEIKNAVIVCWYHDQGLIPFKLLNRRSGVNLTLGLPYIRTSPDHGTASDIAGQGIADPTSMIEAVKLADFLVGKD